MALFGKQAGASVPARMRGIVCEIGKEYDFATFTLNGFIHWLSDRRNQRISCQELNLPVGFFGAWLMVGNENVIVCNEQMIPMHKAHIILHELSHILCGHSTKALTGISEMAQLSEPSVLSRSLLSFARTPIEEQEAETLALMLKEEIMRHRTTRSQHLPVSSIQGLAAFFRLMEL